MEKKNGKKKFQVICGSGLCNRLRVLLSSDILARERGFEVEMIWPKTKECGAFFEDLFENSGFRVLSERSGSFKEIIFNERAGFFFDVLKYDIEGLRLSSFDNFFRPQLFASHEKPNEAFEKSFTRLKPLGWISKKADDFFEENFGSDHVMGVHVRRSDLPHSQNNTSAIIGEMDDFIKRFPAGKFFVATDDGAPWPNGAASLKEGVLDLFQKRFGKDNVISYKARSYERKEKEAVQDALIELLILRKCNEFVGTKGSSFSAFALMGRDIPAKRVGNLFESRKLEIGLKVYVSMAVISSRMRNVHKVLNSILKQTIRADEIRVYISKEPYLLDKGIKEDEISKELEKMQSLGLVKIIYCENIGPYRKLIPILEEKRKEDCIIITADDDTIYPKDWLEKMLECSKREPEKIISFRNKYIGFSDSCLAPYNSWVEISKGFYLENEKKLDYARVLPTGKGGILYKPRFFDETVFDRKFLDLCPYNDDLWFKAAVLDKRIENAIVFSDYHDYSFSSLPDPFNLNLFENNLDENKPLSNDVQLEKISSLFKEKYGKSIYAMLKENKRLGSFESIRARAKKLPGEFWGITVFFNPAKYKNKIENYRKFREFSKKQGLKLLAVELAFENRNFELSCDDAEMLVQIKGDKKNIMWQKEALLNIGLKNLPENCDKFAWLDCDIVFGNPNWMQETCRLLEKYCVVQPYSAAILLPKGKMPKDAKIGKMKNGTTINTKRAGVAYSKVKFGNIKGHPGLAWAARREVFSDIGFYDKFIMGSADVLMSGAFFSPVSMLKKELNSDAMIWDASRWQRECFSLVKGSVYYCNGPLFHLWHGEIGNRFYIERRTVLRKNNFDPARDIMKESSGILRWSQYKKGLASDVKMYFFARSEVSTLFTFSSFLFFIKKATNRDIVTLLDLQKDRILGKIGIMIKKTNPRFYKFLVAHKPKWMQPFGGSI